MGYEGATYQVGFTLDAHAGDRERRDAALHAEVTAALDAVVSLPHFAHMVGICPQQPTDLPPHVRARALLALVEAAETLAGGESIGEYVDVGDVTTALRDVVAQLQWHAFEQQGEGRPGASARLIDGRLMTISDWLDGHNRPRVQ